MFVLSRSPLKALSQKTAKILAAGGMCLLGAGAGFLLGTPRTEAAEEIVFTYGPFQQSFDVENLKAFAETGEVARDVKVLLRYSGQEPETLRRIMSAELNVDFLFLYDALSTLPGEYALFELGNIIHTKSRRANIQALRAAIVMSARGDNRISLLDFFQNYPLDRMYIDGNKALRVASDVNDIIDTVSELLQVPVAVMRDLLGPFICECDRSRFGQ
ncbi:MAG: alpha/beta hydrolase [Cyanobacteria bacterium SBLK]|nr:alpha/beta hydrolase [Cyanobacteria bacterium SBLK]